MNVTMITKKTMRMDDEDGDCPYCDYEGLSSHYQETVEKRLECLVIGRLKALLVRNLISGRSLKNGNQQINC